MGEIKDIRDLNIPLVVDADVLQDSVAQEEDISQLNVPLQNEYTGTSLPEYSQYKLEHYQKYFKTGVDPVFSDINEQRAQNQSSADQFANGLLKGVGLAGTTFLTTFTSLPYGMLEAAANEEFSKVYDNEISNAYDNFNKWMEEYFPNYYTNEEQNAGAFSPKNWFTMNFLSDKLLKNAGFTLGAIGSGAVVAKGIGVLGKLAMSANYADELAAVTKLAKQFTTQGMTEAKAFNQALNQVGKGIKTVNAISSTGAAITAAGSEASIEALGTKQEAKRQYEEELNSALQNGDINLQEYEAKLTEIDDLSSAAANVDFVANMAILSVSNAIQFNKILSGNNTARKAVLNDITRQGGKYVAGTTTRVGRATAKIGAFGGGVITEASEEGSQFVAQKGSTDFYSKKFDAAGKGVVGDAMESTLYGFQQTFGTKEGLESMLLGAITGLVSGVVTGQTRQKLAEIKNRDNITRKLVDRANDITQESFLRIKPEVENAVRSATIQGQMEQAVAKDDLYEYKNLENDLFKSYVLSRIQMGKMDALMDEFDDLANLPQEEFNKRFGIDASVESKTVGEYVALLKSEATKMEQLYTNLELRFPTLSNDSREILFDYAYNIENSGKRMDSLNEQLSGGVQAALNTYLTDQTSENKIVLDEIIKLESPNYQAKGLDLNKLVEDYVKLSERRKEFADKYESAIKDPQGLESKTTKARNKDATLQDKAIISQFENGSVVIDKATGVRAGVVKVVDGEKRLYTSETDYTVPSNEEWLNLYEVSNPIKSNGIGTKNYIRRSDGIGVSVVKLNKTSDDGENLFKVTIGNTTTELTESKLNEEFVFNNKKDIAKAYVRNSDGKQVKIYQAVDGTYRVEEDTLLKNGKRAFKYTELKSKEQLNNEYVFKFTYESTIEQQRNKQLREDTLEELILKTEQQINELNDHVSSLSNIKTLKQELSNLKELLNKPDRRRTQKTINNLINQSQKLSEEIKKENAYLEELNIELNELNNKRDYLYIRLDKLQEEEDATTIKEDIATTEEEIKTNNSLISYFQDSISGLKRIVNALLKLLGLDSAYHVIGKQEIANTYKKEIADRVKTNKEEDKRFGNEIGKAIARIDKYTTDPNENNKELLITAGKINSLQSQVKEYEKKTNIALQQLYTLEEELALYESKVRLANIGKAPETVGSQSYHNEMLGGKYESVSNLNEAGIKEGFQPSKRNPYTIGFNALAGRHVKDDDTLSDDPSQRRYFRFTERTNINQDNFRAELSYGEEKQFDATKKETVDKPIIYATITNKQGQKVDEFGNVTTDPSKFVFTTLLTSEASYLFYKPKNITEEQYKKYIQELEVYYRNIRAAIITKLDANEEVSIKVLSKGKGIPRTFKDINGETQTTNIQDLGIDMNDLEFKVSTANTVAFSGGEITNSKPGFIYTNDKNTGNTIPLGTRVLEENEVNLITQLWKKFIGESKQTKDKNGKVKIDSTSAGNLRAKVGEKIVPIKDTDGKDLSIFRVMSQYVFWAGDNLRADAADKVKKGKISRFNALKDVNNRLNKNFGSPSSFYFMNTTIPGGTLRLGNFEDGPNKGTPRQVDLFVLDKETGQYIENPLFEETLRKFLEGQYINVRAITVNDNRGIVTVNNITKDADGKYYASPNTTNEGTGGYRNWLLSNKMLTSKITPREETTPEKIDTEPQFRSVYAVVDMDSIIDDEKPKPPKPIKKNAKVKKPVAKTTKPKGKVVASLSMDDILGVEESLDGISSDENLTPDEQDGILNDIDKKVDKVEKDSGLTPEQEALFAEQVEADIAEESNEQELASPDSFGDMPTTDANIFGDTSVTPPSSSSNSDSTKFKEATSDVKTQIDINRALAWIHRTFGGRVKVGVLQNLIDGNNWGSYRNNLIKLFEAGETGTEYHETFHAVRDLFLTNKEFKSLVKEWKSYNPKSKLTDDQIEEVLAEDFMDFMLGKDISYFKAPKQKSLFQTILDFIKTFVFNKYPVTIQQVFDNIKSGSYANAPYISAGSGITNYSSILSGLSSLHTKEILDSVHAVFFRSIFSQDDNVASLFDKQRNGPMVQRAYVAAYTSLLTTYKAMYANYKSPKLSSSEKSKVFAQAKEIGKVLSQENWDKLVVLHAESLKKYDLELDYTEWNADISENSRTRDSGQTWAFESLKYSSKINANKNIKLLLASLPFNELNSLGLETTADFGQVFNVLINKLSGLTEWSDMYVAINEMSTDMPALTELLRRLGGDKAGSEMNSNEVILRTQFQQTMAKNENIFFMDTVEGNETTIINANQNSFNKRKINQWNNNAKKIARNSRYYESVNGEIKYKLSKFAKIGDIESIFNAIEFLKLLGIEFSNTQRIEDNKDVRVLTRAQGMLKSINAGSGVLIYNKEEGNAFEDLQVLADIERQTTLDAVENSLYNLDGKLIYGQTLNSYISLIINEINNGNIQSREELFEKLPHLQYVNESLVLNGLFKGGKNKIEFITHLGSKQEGFDANKREFKDLKPADRLRIYINNAMKGRYALLRPADNSLERFIEFGTFFSSNKINLNEHIDSFVNYLKAELDENNFLNGQKWNYLSKNENKGIVLHMIKAIDEGLYNDLIIPGQDINELFEDETNRMAIRGAIINYLDSQIEVNKELMLTNAIVELVDDGYKNNGINLEGNVISGESFTNVASSFTVNNLIANIEQMKVFVGNPRFFKSVEDEFKRHSATVGTKKISIVSEYLNQWIDTFTDPISRLKQQYKYGQPIITTAVFKDIISVSKYLEEYNKVLGKKAAEPYNRSEESDAVGIVHLDEYRRMLLRAGDWSFGKGSLEEAYQYEIGKKTYVDPFDRNNKFTIDKRRVSQVAFTPLKPQHFGPLAEEGFVPALYKLSLAPILPSLTRQFPNLEKLRNQMENQNTGIVVFASGNKVGTKLNDDYLIQEVYNTETGEFAFNKENSMITQDTYYKYWGIQVDMGNKIKNEVIWGTQMAKQIMNNLYSFGKPIAMRFNINGKLTEKSSEETQKLIDKYLELNARRINSGYRELIVKLGLQLDSNGNYQIEDNGRLVEALTDAARSRDMDDNVMNSIKYIGEVGIDTLPNRRKFEQILMAMADKTAISQKTYGGSKVQVSSVFLERNNLREVTSINGVNHIVSNDLNFYNPTFNKKGEIIAVESMEVYLPAIYKGIITTKNISDKRLLDIIGFRIPTQALNSIESIKIAGFLPVEMGDAVVLPSEIVTKTGSDFDIDTLKIFLINFFYDKKGNPNYIDPKMSYTDYLKLVEGTPLKEGFYERAQIENELKEVMKIIITSPDNIQQLLIPNNVDTLKSESIYNQYLQYKANGLYTGEFKDFTEWIENEELNTPYNNIVETSYLMDVAKRFLGGNAAIGITALFSTFHILAQRHNLQINKEYVKHTKDKDIVTSTRINMDHNGEGEYINLGGVQDVNDKNSIVQLFNMWINASVDAATDPFMFLLNATPQTLNTVLYLTMAGVPIKTIGLFMNQPIIHTYMANQNKYESLMADSVGLSVGGKIVKYQNQILALTKSEYTGKTDITIDDTIQLTDSILEAAILDKGKSGNMQQQILYDFIRYQEVAKEISNAMQGTTYDTKGGGKSLSELAYRLGLTQQVIDNKIILGYEELINSGFIQPYHSAVAGFGKAFEAYVPHLRNPQVVDMYKEFMQKYLQRDVSFKIDDVVNTMDKFKEDFLVYLMMNYSKDETGTILKDEINRLFKGKSSMANRVEYFKKKYPHNSLLNNLFTIFSSSTAKDAINNLKMYITRLDNIESNQLTKDWKDMIEGSSEESKFGRDLIKFIILQSGLQNSPLNFVNLAPVDEYVKMMNGVLQVLSKTNNTFSDYPAQFAVQNQHDKTVVPRSKKPGFDFYIKKTFKGPITERDLSLTDNNKTVKVINPPIRNFKESSTLNAYGIMELPNLSTSTSQILEEDVQEVTEQEDKECRMKSSPLTKN